MGGYARQTRLSFKAATVRGDYVESQCGAG